MAEQEKAVRSGFAAIAGKPNAGKSTLLNALLGQKLVITNPKPQTTRRRIAGILSEEEYQVIFLDTPGIIEPHYLLQERMMHDVWISVADADVVLLLVDITESKDIAAVLAGGYTQLLRGFEEARTILILNKCDLAEEPAVREIREKILASRSFLSVIALSAREGSNLAVLREAVVAALPLHPKYYPDDIVSDEQERFFVTEIIREKILEKYQDEIPYSCEVGIEDFKEREEGKHYIAAVIYVERDSQKGIVIGKRGTKLKEVGEAARKDIEEFLQHPVYLEMFVKVKSEWRRDPRALRQFGYERSDDD